MLSHEYDTSVEPCRYFFTPLIGKQIQRGCRVRVQYGLANEKGPSVKSRLVISRNLGILARCARASQRQKTAGQETRTAKHQKKRDRAGWLLDVASRQVQTGVDFKRSTQRPFSTDWSRVVENNRNTFDSAMPPLGHCINLRTGQARSQEITCDPTLVSPQSKYETRTMNMEYQ